MSEEVKKEEIKEEKTKEIIHPKQDEIEKMLKEGKSIREICKTLHVSSRDVVEIRKLLGLSKAKEIEKEEGKEFEKLEEAFFEAEKPPPKPTEVEKPAVVLPKPEIPISLVEKLIQMPFKIVARITNYEGWLLTMEETNELAPLTKQLLDKYMPTLVLQYGLEVTFCVTLISIVGLKYEAYSKYKASLKEVKKEEKREEKKEEKPKETKEEVKKEEVKPTIEKPTPSSPQASDFLKRLGIT